MEKAKSIGYYGSAVKQSNDRRCTCGDSKKLKAVFKQFATRSTMHGAIYLHPKSSKKCIWLWRLLLLLCMVSVTINLVTMMIDIINTHPVYVTTINKRVSEDDDLKDFPRYPAVTLCRMPPYKNISEKDLAHAVRYSYNALGMPFVSMSAEQKSLLFNPNFNKVKYDVLKDNLKKAERLFQRYKSMTKDFDISKFIYENSARCEDIFSGCYMDFVALNCCSIFEPILTAFGPCFTLKQNDIFLSALQMFDKLGDTLFILELFSPVSFDDETQQIGYSIMLKDPGIPAFFGKQTLIAPEFMVDIAVRLKFSNRQAFYDSWLEWGSTCPSLPDSLAPFLTNRERYEKKDCYRLYFDALMKAECSCVSIFEVIEGNNTKLRTCEPVDFLMCFVQSAKKENATKVQDVCKEPCIEYSYEFESSYVKLENPNRASISRVMISYATDEYMYNEYKRFTISTFFSQIGGSLGLMLGASIITVIEFTIFFLQTLWYLLVPTRKRQIKSTTNSSNRKFLQNDLDFYGKDH